MAPSYPRSIRDSVAPSVDHTRDAVERSMMFAKCFSFCLSSHLESACVSISVSIRTNRVCFGLFLLVFDRKNNTNFPPQTARNEINAGASVLSLGVQRWPRPCDLPQTCPSWVLGCCPLEFFCVCFQLTLESSCVSASVSAHV